VQSTAVDGACRACVVIPPGRLIAKIPQVLHNCFDISVSESMPSIKILGGYESECCKRKTTRREGMKDDPTDIRSAAMDAFVEQPVQPASTCRKHENTVVHMAGQPVQPAPTCMEHAQKDAHSVAAQEAARGTKRALVATHYEATQLEQRCVDFIIAHMNDVVKTDDFGCLSWTQPIDSGACAAWEDMQCSIPLHQWGCMASRRAPQHILRHPSEQHSCHRR
jgi:hypothetical protein